MICSSCGGHVTWRGPMSNLTHTECARCGRHNSQTEEGVAYYSADGCIECDWGELPCHCTGTPYGVDFEDHTHD